MTTIDRQVQKDKIYLNIAREISKLSKDKDTQIGCIIIAEDGTPVSFGYNGTISGWNDKYIPHSREKKKLTFLEDMKTVEFGDNKYNYMSHAEANAMDYAVKDKLKGSTIYLTNPPCKDCALRMAKLGIKNVTVSNGENKKGSTINQDLHVVKFILAQAEMNLTIDSKEIWLDKAY